MKRIGNLYERVISLENLRLADEKARKGKLRSYGVMIHDKNRDANLLALHESLKKRYVQNIQVSHFHDLRTQGTSYLSVAILSRPNLAPRDNERA